MSLKPIGQHSVCVATGEVITPAGRKPAAASTATLIRDYNPLAFGLHHVRNDSFVGSETTMLLSPKLHGSSRHGSCEPSCDLRDGRLWTCCPELPRGSNQRSTTTILLKP